MWPSSSCFGSDVAPRLGRSLREFLPLLMPLYNPAVISRVGSVTVDLLLAGSLVGFFQAET